MTVRRQTRLMLTALVAAIPVLVLCFMVGVQRKPGWMAALTALGMAFILALVAYGMPVGLAAMSAITGAAYGLFPIAWIVFASIMLYRLAVDTGKFAIIKDSVGGLTTDRRLQALFIAFSFGAFIEGAAGFGAPVAVSGAMLVGLGFSPFYAAGICLIANTAPVAFGRMLMVPARTSFSSSPSKYCMPSSAPSRIASSSDLPSFSPISMYSRVRMVAFSISMIAMRPPSFFGISRCEMKYWNDEARRLRTAC